MAEHPSRSRRRSPAANPDPCAIRKWRRDRELSAMGAAALIHTTARVWLQWEAGERRMHPAFWELALVKVECASPNGPA